MMTSQTQPVVRLAASCLLAFFLTGCGVSELDQAAPEHEQWLETQAAVIELKRVLQEDPSDARTRLALGLAKIDLGDLATARNEFQRAAELGLGSADVHIPLARMSLAAGEYEQVLESLTWESPEAEDELAHLEVLLLRGEALLGTGQMEAAMGAFLEVVTLNPESTLAHVGIASIHATQGDLHNARASLGTALAIDSRRYEAWSLLADLERHEGRMERAAAYYGLGIEFAPNPYFLYFKRSLTRVTLGDMEGAEEDRQAMRAVNARHPATPYLDGIIHYHSTRYADAQSAFQHSLTLSQGFQPAFFYLIASLVAQQQWRQAAYQLELFLREHPESDSAARLLAAALLREGSIARAERLLVSLLNRSPDDILALHLIATLESARGAHEATYAHLQHLVELQPENALARVKLATWVLEHGAAIEAGIQLEASVPHLPVDQQIESKRILELVKNGEIEVAIDATERLRDQLPMSISHNRLGLPLSWSRTRRGDHATLLAQSIDLHPEVLAPRLRLVRSEIPYSEIMQVTFVPPPDRRVRPPEDR